MTKHKMSQMSQTAGNTKAVCKRRRSRKYTFTLNNYTENEYNDILNFVSQNLYQYVIGKEVGENLTPHLQGYIEHKNQIDFNLIKKVMPRAHLECARGSTKQNYKYCTKDSDFVTNIIIPPTPEEEYNEYMKEEYKDVEWKPWQQAVIDLINTTPSKRIVYWLWEEQGNEGKTFLAKYLDWKYDAIIANGKQADVFNQYREYLKTKQPKLAIIDIPRSHELYVCYSTLEKIKDGLCYSGKYEGGKLRIIPHHLLIFANFEPPQEMLSLDRWRIINITDDSQLINLTSYQNESN